MDAIPMVTMTAPKTSRYAQVRVTRETRRMIMQDLARLNRKRYGRSVRAEQYLRYAIGKLTEQDRKNIQDQSLTASDRLERDYREYMNQHGEISKDAYLLKVVRNEVSSSLRQTLK